MSNGDKIALLLNLESEIKALASRELGFNDNDRNIQCLYNLIMRPTPKKAENILVEMIDEVFCEFGSYAFCEDETVRNLLSEAINNGIEFHCLDMEDFF